MDEYGAEKKATELASTTPKFVTIKEEGQDRKLFLDFAGLMPPHSPEEYFGLAADIVQKGECSDPIKVWRDLEQNRYVLLDGYLRLDICVENQIQLPEVTFVDLPNHDAARDWIIDQQLNRRNLGI